MPVTTDSTIGRDCQASLEMQRGIPVGQTWAQFKAAMTLLGVRDEDRIASIEFGVRVGFGRIVREDEADGVVIREARRG